MVCTVLEQLRRLLAPKVAAEILHSTPTTAQLLARAPCPYPDFVTLSGSLSADNTQGIALFYCASELYDVLGDALPADYYWLLLTETEYRPMNRSIPREYNQPVWSKLPPEIHQYITTVLANRGLVRHHDGTITHNPPIPPEQYPKPPCPSRTFRDALRSMLSTAFLAT
jgi:hypothetical protein